MAKMSITGEQLIAAPFLVSCVVCGKSIPAGDATFARGSNYRCAPACALPTRPKRGYHDLFPEDD